MSNLQSAQQAAPNQSASKLAHCKFDTDFVNFAGAATQDVRWQAWVQSFASRFSTRDRERARIDQAELNHSTDA